MDRLVKLFMLCGACALCLFWTVGCDRKAQKAQLGIGGTSEVRDAKTKGGDRVTSAAPIRTQIAELTTTGMDFVRLTGTLYPDEKSQVAARVTGIVSDVPVDRGTLVKKGDVLAHLDPIDLQNALNEGIAAAEEIRVRLGMQPGQADFRPEDQPEVQQAASKLDLARTSHNRIISLMKQNVLPQSDADKAISDLQTAEQAYNQTVAEARRLYQSYTSAKIRLVTLSKSVADTTVTAPFDGMVSEKLASVGERLSATSGNVVTLVRIDPIRLFLTVSERDLPFIQNGDELEFTVAAFPDRIFKAKVARVGAELDAKTRALVVECTASNTDDVLRPGMFAIARLPLHGRQRIPIGASAFDQATTATDETD